MTSLDIKQELLSKIEQLPPSRLSAILQFINEFPELKETSPESITAQDPLLDFIGQGNHGSLAHNIDDNLYGQ